MVLQKSLFISYAIVGWTAHAALCRNNELRECFMGTWVSLNVWRQDLEMFPKILPHRPMSH